MKKVLLGIIGTSIFFWTAASIASQGVAIQRVITNTRSELGQLASSNKAQDIAELMKKFDTQYDTWSQSCVAENFNPDQVSDACKAMADQMRETGINLYGSLSDYLPDVATRYEQGAQASKNIIDTRLNDQTPAGLYQSTLEGISEAPKLGNLSQGDAASPFDLEMNGFPDPTEQMFEVLEKLVPDFGKEIPETVRAGNAHISMKKKARQARYLANQFSKAQFVLESQREYGEIIFNATNAVNTMPKVLGLQYTGTRLNARPNLKVLDYYKRSTAKAGKKQNTQTLGGFAPRS